MRTFHIPINLDFNGRGSREGHKPLHLSNELKKFWFISFFVHGPLIVRLIMTEVSIIIPSHFMRQTADELFSSHQSFPSDFLSHPWLLFFSFISSFLSRCFGKRCFNKPLFEDLYKYLFNTDLISCG